MSYQDQHLHYTGSLPLLLVWQKIRKSQGTLVDIGLLDELFSEEVSKKIKRKNYSERTYLLFKKDIKMLFYDKNDHIYNYDRFFKLYKLIQNITKPKNDREIEPSYREGVNAIISSLSKSGVSKFDIFAGPLLNINKTKSRLQGMIQGIEDNEHLPIKGSIRLTFINTENGYINLSNRSLESLLELIISDNKMSSYISGFDFSGNENTNNINIISSTIKRLNAFDKKNFWQNGRKFKISVHAGENFINIPPENYLSYFNTLLDMPIDSIGHGIFLWIPDKFINYSQKTNKNRRQLLEKVVEKNIELEICPTSNVLFSPLKSYKDIPFNFFDKIGLRYSINTDNMTILSTDIKTEWKMASK